MNPSAAERDQLEAIVDSRTMRSADVRRSKLILSQGRAPLRRINARTR